MFMSSFLAPGDDTRNGLQVGDVWRYKLFGSPGVRLLGTTPKDVGPPRTRDDIKQNKRLFTAVELSPRFRIVAIWEDCLGGAHLIRFETNNNNQSAAYICAA